MKFHWNRIGTAHTQIVCLTLFGLAITFGSQLAEGTCYLSPCAGSGQCCVGQGQAPCACCTGAPTNSPCICSVQCYGTLCPQTCLTQCGTGGIGTCGQQVEWYNGVGTCNGSICVNGCGMTLEPILCYQQWQCNPADQEYSDSQNPSECSCPCTVNGTDDNCTICASPWGGPPLIISLSLTSCSGCHSS